MIAKLKPTFQEPCADLRRRLKDYPPRLPANRGQIEVVSGQSQWHYCPEEIDDLLKKENIDEETSIKLLQVADHMIMLFGAPSRR